MIKNVLFITADQWRGSCLSALGHSVVKTPNLDRLASSGVLFSQHYAQSTPCSPSRASIHTGMYLKNHRVCNNGTPLDRRFTNIAQEARQCGFDPVLFGYTDTALDPRDLAVDDPQRKTYETVLPGYSLGQELREAPLPWVQWLADKGYLTPEDGRSGDIYRQFDDLHKEDKRGVGYLPAPYSAEHTETAFLNEKVMQYIDAKGDDSWFIHLSWLRPHPPFLVPEPYHSMYRSAQTEAPVRHPSLAQEQAQHPYVKFVIDEKLARDPSYGSSLLPTISDEDLHQLKTTYYGMMTEVDAQMGRLLDFLTERNLLESTLIVFSSDHGEQLGDHYLLSKLGFFDQSYHIPLIIRAPGPEWNASRGAKVPQFSENIDLMPTILDLLGATPPAQCDGFSLRPFLEAKANFTWRTCVHWEYDFRDVLQGKPEQHFGLSLDECSLAVIRDYDYKYVHFNQLPALLFDLKNDPHELNNLAQNPDFIEVTLTYAQKMLNWHMRNEDRSLTGWFFHTDGPTQRLPEDRNTQPR